MASKGTLSLENAVIIDMYDKVKEYETTVQDAFYSEYKNAFKLSDSNYFRGTAADSFKEYIKNGAINIITEFMDVTADVTMIIQLLAEAYFQYEKTHNGKVDEPTLDYIEETLKSKKGIFESFSYELSNVLSAASQYIYTKDLELNNIHSSYGIIEGNNKNIRNDLYSVDDESLVAANELFDRITALKNLIIKMTGFCYNESGKLNVDNLGKVPSQEWYSKAGNVALYLKLQEDPFKYSAGEVTTAEDQWAAGLCSDVYAYAGYSFNNGSYEAGVENGTAFVKAAYTLAEANGYAQFTNYLCAAASVKALYGKGDAKAGWSDKYKGFHVDAEVGVVSVEGSVILGTDDLNAFVKGEAKLLCADGKVAFEFEEDGQFAIGVDASATAASAEVKGGTSIFSYKKKDSATGKSEPLLGFKVGAEASAGGDIAVWAESDTAIETDYVNINATTVKLKLTALLGLDFSITVPTPYFKWPW